MKNEIKIAGTHSGAEARAVYTTTTAVSQALPTTTVGTGGHRHST